MPARGQPSNNPKGRPPKSRALTDMLAKAFDQAVEGPDGKKVAAKKLMAEFMRQAVTTGRIRFADGSVLRLSPRDWLDTVWRVYEQVDGKPRQEMDVTTGGEPLGAKAYIGFTPGEWDAESDPDSPL